MVASANGVVAWRRRDAKDDPVLAILGGDRTHPARVADKLHMRYLRCFGDVSVGAETVRTQPELVLSPQQPSDEPLPELFAFREHAALPRQPRNIVYSIHGRLPMTHRIFTTPGIHPVVMTTAEGGAEVRRRGRAARAGDRRAARPGRPAPGSRAAVLGARRALPRLRGRGDGAAIPAR